MTGRELVRSADAMLWELRDAWGSGKRVALSLTDRCDHRRLEGHVETVSTTGVSVCVNGHTVPIAEVLAVHYPAILGDSTYRDGVWRAESRIPQQIPGQLELTDG